MSDFRQMKWQVKGIRNSVPITQIQPRITMITCVDTLGNCYMALAQSNSNSKIMELFFRSLFRKLERERRMWRQDSVILIDGAKYHQSRSLFNLFEEMNVPLMILAPYSFEMAPCEKFFAIFKSIDINPRKLPLGKS